MDFTSGDHGGQKRSAVHVAGQNQQPGRIAVQSVNAAVGEGFVFLRKIPGTGICQRIVVISLGGMDRHVGRLIDHEQILIFVDNGKRKRNRKDVLGRSVFRELNGQHIARHEGIVNMCPGSVSADPVFCFFQMADDSRRIPMGF